MNNLTNINGMPIGGQQRQAFTMQFQNNQLGNANPGAVAMDYSWQAGYTREQRDNIINESQFPNIYKQFQVPQKFVLSPQYQHQFAQKAEEEAWKQSSSQLEYQRKCMENLRLITRWHLSQIQNRQQQQLQASLNNNEDRQAQMQMLLQQNQGQQQQQQPQQIGLQQIPNQQQLQMPQNQQGLNLGNNMFQRNAMMGQDTSGTLAMTMQNYIQSQQAASQQQQRAQQQAQQQQQQQQQVQQQQQQQQQQAQQLQQQIPPQQLMRSQFNIGQNPVNATNLNTLNSNNMFAQQQAYAANLAAAQQRQGNLSNLNQPINPPASTQPQQTPQQRPAQFPQLQDTTLNQQLRNPLQSPAQPQQQVSAQEIEKIAQDIATYKFWMSFAFQRKGNSPEPPMHLKDQHDKALQRFQQLRTSNPGLTDQVRNAMAEHTKNLEAKVNMRPNLQNASDGTQAGVAAANVPQPNVNSVQQHLQQGQAGQKQPQQFNRGMNQPLTQDQLAQLSQQPQLTSAQIQNLRAQTQGISRTASGQGIANQQMNQQVPQTIPQQPQVQNPIQNLPMTAAQQLQMVQQMQLQQQQRQLVNNQQMLPNLNQGAAMQTPQMVQLQQQMQLQQLQQQQRAAGDNNASAINPNRILPQENNPHNFPIPFESQQKLIAIGVPAERLLSWKEVINWLQEAFKRRSITEEQYGKVKNEYHQVATAMNANPRAFLQQFQNRNAANPTGMQAQNQQLVNQLQQNRQLSGQQMPPQQSIQNATPSVVPQVQMNMAAMQQVPLQMPPQPPAPALQSQVSQQPQTMQPQAQVQPPQARKPRPPQKKPPAKKGQDASNPMVIGNTPTPTNVPTPSPAQHPAVLPTSTPMNMRSPAPLAQFGSTPQAVGISPSDMHTPSHGEQMQMQQNPMEGKNQDLLLATNFVKGEIEKIKVFMQTTWLPQQNKVLSPEEKQQMKILLGNHQTLELLGRIERLATPLYLLTRDENKVINFLRLRQIAFFVLEGASKDRHICTPDEWQRTYAPAISSQVTQVLTLLSKAYGRPMAANAASPLVNNPAGIPINLGKHSLRQEDLHIPASKRRRSGVAVSASPASTSDPATVPQITQTPSTMGTPMAYPLPTPTAGVKRPPTSSPVSNQLPPSKVQVGSTGPMAARDKAQEEAVAKRLAKERAEELERQEQRKNPLEYAKNAMYKAMGAKRSENPGSSELPPPKLVPLADQVQNVATSNSESNGASSAAPANSEKHLAPQKDQLPSPPWSGTMTPRQLAETFANRTEFQFALNSTYLLDNVRSAPDDFSGGLMGDMLADSGETEDQVTDEFGDLDFLSPLAGDLGWDESYSWTKNLRIPWNGDISSIVEQTNSVGVIA